MCTWVHAVNTCGSPDNYVYTENYGISLGPDHARVTLLYTMFISKKQAEAAVALFNWQIVNTNYSTSFGYRFYAWGQGIYRERMVGEAVCFCVRAPICLIDV